MNPNPLSKTDLANAQAGLYECNECEKLASAMAACGLDCQEEMARNEHLRQFYQGILAQFNPAAWNQGSP
jgi:hypothetical protein